MPPRKPAVPDANADQSTPPPGALEDASEKLAAEQTEQTAGKASRRNHAENPVQGDSVRLRGKVVEPVQEVTRNGRGRAEASLQVQGRLINGVTGEAVSDEKEWTVVVTGYMAGVSKEVLKEGDDVEAPGTWTKTYRAGRYTVDSEIQAVDIHPPLAARLGQEISAPSVADSGAAGGQGIA